MGTTQTASCKAHVVTRAVPAAHMNVVHDDEDDTASTVVSSSTTTTRRTEAANLLPG